MSNRTPKLPYTLIVTDADEIVVASCPLPMQGMTSDQYKAHADGRYQNLKGRLHEHRGTFDVGLVDAAGYHWAAGMAGCVNPIETMALEAIATL